MAINNTVARVLQGFGPLFYLVPPSKSSFKSPNDVPNYVQEVSGYHGSHGSEDIVCIHAGNSVLLRSDNAGGRNPCASKKVTAAD